MPGRRVRGRELVAAGGPLVVLAFWWLATGTLLAAQREGTGRLVAAAIGVVAAAGGAWLLARSRAWPEPRDVVQSFLGGGLLWTAVSAALYGGWVVGPAGGPASGPASGPAGVAPGGTLPHAAVASDRLALAFDALRATAYSDALGLVAIAFAAALVWRSPTRTGLWALVVLWAAHQTARLNVFLGVANGGAELLPSYLASLRRYFGPPENSALLPATVVALGALTAWFAWRARTLPTRGTRTGAALLATLAALAALEHALLSTTWQPPLWQLFLALRSG